MSEEKNGLVAEVEDGPVTDPEISEVEVEETPAVEEEVDEKGVSLKNRLAELERKTTAQVTELKAEKDHLLNMLKEVMKPKEIQKVEDKLHTPEEYNACETMAQFSALKDEDTKILVKEALKEQKAQEEKMTEPQRIFQRDLAFSLELAQDAAGGEGFGDFVRNGMVDRNSAIAVRTDEILSRDPELKKLPIGRAFVKASKLALKELRAEKKDPTLKHNTVAAVNRSLGSPKSKGGQSAPMERDDHFIRELTPAELLALPDAKQQQYLRECAKTRNFTQ